MFLTQAASCGFVWEFQTFVSMNIWLNAFKNVNYLMINSLWHSKNLNKSFVFKTRPGIGESFKRTKDYFKKSERKMLWKLVQILEEILMIPFIWIAFYTSLIVNSPYYEYKTIWNKTDYHTLKSSKTCVPNPRNVFHL